MKTIGKIFLATVLALFVTGLTWTSSSEADRGGHYGGNYRGNYRNGHTNYYNRGMKGYGHRRQLPYGQQYYRNRYGLKHRYSHGGQLGRRRYTFGIYLGQDYHTYYRYPFSYRYGYFYKPYQYGWYNTIPYYYPGSYGPMPYSTGGGYDVLDEGWNLLRRGRPAEAADVFGRLCQASPSEGMPKVGYALAAAELGRLDKGIWAMRRALREDPESLQYVTIDQQLQPKVEAMLKRYQQSDKFDDSSDGAFMVAALHYLLGDMAAAQKAMERGGGSHDTYTSAANLKRLIEQGSNLKFE